MFSSFAACGLASLTSRNLPWRKVAISRARRSSPSTMNSSPACGTSVRPWISTGIDGPASLIGLPSSSSIARTRPKVEPASTTSPRLSVPRLHQHGRDRAAALVELRFDDQALGQRVDRRLQFQHFGLQQHLLEQRRRCPAPVLADTGTNGESPP